MIGRLLIANRGEIARRIMRTAADLGVETVAVYSDADAAAAFVREADQAVRVGPPPARESYLNIEAILEAAASVGADAVHPGYGFLAENADFAEACEGAGLVFVGPPPDAIRAMGRKDRAKALMADAGVPVTPGYLGEDQSDAALADAAAEIGYPVLIKAVAGGGGKGMRVVERPADFADALASARREAQAAFGDDVVLLEKLIASPRHIEVQVFADNHGGVVHLFERDCSLQRRSQKVVEEAPAPGMTEETRAAMCAAAVAAAKAVGYRNAGTVEFIVDGARGLRPDGFWFMEMNTRLQVEHPVTELVTGLDLVAMQLAVASGGKLRPQDEITLQGCAIEARIYAEDPAHGFLPSAGPLEVFDLPAFAEGDGGDVALRLDSGVEAGDEVSPHYDPMIAKAIAHAPTREVAAAALADALKDARIWPVRANASFLARALAHPGFVAGEVDTGFLARHADDLIPARDAATMAALVAAVDAITQDGASAAAPDPWAAGDGWRLNAPSRISRAYDIDGARWDVALRPVAAGYALDVGGRVFAATPTAVADDGSACELLLDGEPYVLGVARRPDALVAFLDGDAIAAGVPRPEAAAEALEGGDAVIAPMPGKVIEARAAPGEAVEAGATLFVLEAMKMEHALRAPRNGVVDAAPVAEGALVAKGDVLATLKPAD